MYYFSYGSNMSSQRLRYRVQSVFMLGTAVLRRHELKFHKVGHRDQTSKCDVIETGDPQHFVMGVVFDISAPAKSILDEFEGLGSGYAQKQVQVELHDGRMIETFTYYATHIDPHLKPLDWYKQHVLVGAKEHGLPDEYIQKIAAVESVPDPDAERHARELAIYR